MATVYSPTYYGPVPVVTTPGTQTLDSQTQGTIDALVAQPFNEAYPSVGADGTWRYTEVYKGKTSLVKDLPRTHFTPGKQRYLARSGLTFVDRFSAPECPNDKSWFVDSVSVRQNTAGDTSEIRINYIAKGFSASGETWTSKDEDNIWQLQWQPYSLSPYAFCANPGNKDKTPKQQASDNDRADRYNIEKFLQQNKVDLSGCTYFDDNGVQRKLNKAEMLIMKKILNGTNCQWHYPVLIHETSDSANLSAMQVVTPPIYPHELGGVDYTYQQSAPSLQDCPFNFELDYEWVKVDDSITCQRTTGTITYKRSQKWMGVISADVNYYGIRPFSHNNLENCRWIPGSL